jgi:dihydroflavonol-4-reductase
VRVLVTGAGGFVGAAIARALQAGDWEVVGTHRRPVPAHRWTRGVALIATDLRECAGLPAACDYLVHCAAEVPARCPDEAELVRSNLEGTARVLEYAERAGVRRVASMSSMAVYGATRVPLVDESTAPQSPNAYGRAKLDCERLLDEWCARTGARGVSLRLPGIVGAGARNNFLGDSLARILAGEPVRARDPDAPFNNVVHVADLAAFVATLWDTMPAGHAHLTLGGVEPLAIRTVLERLYERAGRVPDIRWTPSDVTPFLLGFERARALGFRPATVASSVDRFVADSLAERACASS